MERLLNKNAYLKRITDRIKRVHDLLHTNLIEYENEVSKELLTWASKEPNYNLELVFSCLADLTDAYTKCVEQQCDKLCEFRNVFKTISKEEGQLRRTVHKQKQADDLVSNLQEKVARESRHQNQDRSESQTKVKLKLTEAVHTAETGRQNLKDSKEQFEQFKATSLRKALIDFNNDYINILSDMSMIYKTKLRISELLGDMPVTTVKELEPNLAEGNSIVKQTFETLNEELPMRDRSLDRWQIHRIKYTMGMRPSPSPGSNRKRSQTPPPTRPPPQRGGHSHLPKASSVENLINATYDDEYDINSRYDDDDDFDSFSSDDDPDHYAEPNDDMVHGYLLPIATNPQNTRFPTGYEIPIVSDHPHSPPHQLPSNPIESDELPNGATAEFSPDDPMYTVPEKFQPHKKKLPPQKKVPPRPTVTDGHVRSKESISFGSPREETSSRPIPPRKPTHIRQLRHKRNGSENGDDDDIYSNVPD